LRKEGLGMGIVSKHSVPFIAEGGIRRIGKREETSGMEPEENPKAS
jgi:hypothetical protein